VRTLGLGRAGSELLSLAVHPSELVAATAASGGDVRLWALDKRALRAARTLPSDARQLDFAPDGARLAAALESGAVLLLDSGTPPPPLSY
jgi:WD40 repeat protein